MSKNITVSEGNTARVFGNTKKLETKLQGDDAGTCSWVPEDETDAQPLYIAENGLYEASEAGVYGFSEAHVNISKKVTDDDGTDWNIHIDDDDIPHITVDDPDDPYSGTDISIDDGTGDIDIHIPGKNPDDWPEWDNLDPEVKIDFDDWMDDPKIPGDWPGWDDLAPEIVDEFDNWLDDGNDPDLWPGWDDLDPDEKTDFDDWMDDPKDPDDWPGWEDIDPDIKTDFDDWTADTDTEIDPEEAGLDPDEDVDTSFDPDEHDVSMVGTDVDGDEAVVKYDPETGETVITNLPYSISVVMPPTVTEYSDGATIDFSGMVVKGYLKSGDLWTDSSHPNGIIPISELTLPVTIAHADQGGGASSDLDTGSFSQPIPLSGVATFAFTQTNVPIRKTYTWTPANGAMVIIRNTENSTVLLFEAKQAGEVGLERCVSTDERTSEQRTEFRYITAGNSFTHDGKTVYYVRSNNGHANLGIDRLVNPVVSNYGDDSHDKEAAWTAIYGDITSGYQVIPVQYMSGEKTLGSSFTITVNPS